MWSVLANESPQKLFGRLQIQIPQETGITYGFESEPASNQSGDKISFVQTYSIAQKKNKKKKKKKNWATTLATCGYPSSESENLHIHYRYQSSVRI